VGLGLLATAALATLWIRGRAPSPSPEPRVALPAVAALPAPAAVPPHQAEVERLLAEAGRPGPAAARLSAYYRARGLGAGPTPAKLVPGQLEALRDSLLASGPAGGEAAAALLELLSVQGGLPPAAREMASQDLSSRYGAPALDALASRLVQLDLHTRGLELGRASRTRKDAAERPRLEATARQFAATPGGRLWGALAAHVPGLLARAELPLASRQGLVRPLAKTRGLELLYLRAGLPPLLESEKALAKVMSFSAVPLEKSAGDGASASELAALAWVPGKASDLLVSKAGEAAFVHKDAETWFFGALGRGDQLPNYKDSLTLRSVELPAQAEGREADSFTFVAWVRDLDPEDGFMLKFLRPGGEECQLTVPVWRPDVRADSSGHLLCVTRVARTLLPAGVYDLRIEPWRWVIHREFLRGQERMASTLIRLTLAVQ
jgi:hypothetical protein